MRLYTANGLRTRQHALVTTRLQYRALHVAIVGGGITGLTSAYQLTKNPNITGITIYEKSPRLGGWMRSERVPVKGGDVLFEYGPRTIRCSDALGPTWRMARSLGLEDEAIWTPKWHPAASNRFIYYPDRLVRLPTPRPGHSFWANLKELVGTIYREPLFKTVIPALLLENSKPSRPMDEWHQDESVASFISRRFSPEIADNIASAGIHGIYAGDIDKLSAQTLMGSLRNMDDGIIMGMFNRVLTGKIIRLTDDVMVDSLTQSQHLAEVGEDKGRISEEKFSARAKSSATLTFKQGTQQLVDAMAAYLKESKIVQIKTNSEVQAMGSLAKLEKLQITSRQNGGGSNRATYDRVVASIPSPALAKILETANTNHPGQSLAHETIRKLKLHDYAVTVMVVNLYYDNPNILPVNGFGYLIPRSVPYENNPECGLGVLFASSSSHGCPTSMSPDVDQFVSQDNAPGTKITVMLGGHYWDGWKDTDYPNHETAVEMARAMLERQIGIKEAPSVARSSLQKNAIPQYLVGHIDRMYDLSATVKDEFNRQLILAGNWYTGVGVNDCIRQGVLAATYGMKDAKPQPKDHDYSTGDVSGWDMVGGIPTAPVKYAVNE
ncbi:hypothetical protein N7454_008867 [Penicillium verhagenii]|nr:hypothetical protein N7454_008867 [Penicillium verhagenii]